jgi:hypothetical protein
MVQSMALVGCTLTMWVGFDLSCAANRRSSGLPTSMGFNPLGQMDPDRLFFSNSPLQGVIFGKTALPQHPPQPSRGASGTPIERSLLARAVAPLRDRSGCWQPARPTPATAIGWWGQRQTAVQGPATAWPLAEPVPPASGPGRDKRWSAAEPAGWSPVGRGLAPLPTKGSRYNGSKKKKEAKGWPHS